MIPLVNKEEPPRPPAEHPETVQLQTVTVESEKTKDIDESEPKIQPTDEVNGKYWHPEKSEIRLPGEVGEEK